MKRINQLIPIFVLVAPSLVAIARAQDTSSSGVDATVVTQDGIDAQVDASLQKLADFVGDNDAAVGQLEVLKAQLCQLGQGQLGQGQPGSQPGPGRAEPMPLEPNIEAVIEAVIRSARIGFMTHFEAAFVREQVLEARLDRVLRVLEQRATSTGWDQDVHDAVVAQLAARARMAVGYPDAAAARARLEAILINLRAGVHPRVATFDALRSELIRGRLYRYFQFLTGRARCLGLSREVVQPYLALLVERARLMAIAK